MFPLVAVLGFTVVAGTMAWLLDSATEEEERRHDELRNDIRQRNQRLRNMEFLRENQRLEYVKKGLAQSLLELEVHRRELFAKITPIEEELHHLPQNLEQELRQEAISPYRRRALQQSHCKIEDAQSRLQAYKAYLAAYQCDLDAHHAQLSTTTDVECLEEILNSLQPPSPTLPAEWLYTGKVVLVDHSELDADLPFNSRLHLTNNRGLQGWSNDFQQSLLLGYPKQDSIPLQILKEKQSQYGKRLFYGCIARGSAYVDGILAGKPLTFSIERKVPAGYFAHTAGKAINAFLPRHLTNNPLIDLLPGQTIEAYPDLYTLTLDAVPGGKEKDRRIKISMLGNVELGSVESTQLYLYLEAELIHEEWQESLYANDPTPWHLLSSDETGITIARHEVRCECQIDVENACLRVTHLSEFQTSIEGYELPFTLIPADARLENVLLRNPDALDALLGFINNVSCHRADDAVRLAQTRLLSLWGEVLEYQQQQNEFHIEGLAAEVSKEGYDAIVMLQPDGSPALGLFLKEFRDVLKAGFTPQCRLAYWGEITPGQYGWLEPLAAYERRRLTVYEDENRIALRLPAIKARAIAELSADSSPACLLRLSLYLVDDALKRQRDALDCFRNDTLVEPRIKDILLSPSSYRSEQDNYWLMRFREGIQWQNRQLTLSQKQVIESVLCEKYLSLVQGPPGTAKTTCIVELLHQIYTYRPETRVLLVSQQHAAVDNALERFIDLNSQQLEEQQIRLLRIGPEKKVEGKLRQFTIQQRQQEFVQNSRVAVTEAIASGGETQIALAERWIEDVLCPASEEGQNGVDQELVWMLLSNNNLVGATCVGLASRKQSIDQLRFDVVIIDEAGRSTVPELMIPMLRAKKVVLIGDHFQLPPSVAPLLQTDDAAEEMPFLQECFLETSFFETLYGALPESSRNFLSEQFRMPVQIGNLVAHLFYSPEGKRLLHNGQIKDTSGFIYPVSLIWKDIRGIEESEGTSKRNYSEAASITHFLHNLANQEGIGCKDVAVITPYGAQKRLLRQLLAKHCEEDNGEYRLGNLRIRINTVDSFQGSEADVVLYSVVRTRGNLRFILDWKRLNVACSRAKENLIFFGDYGFLKRKRLPNEERNLFAEVIALIPEDGVVHAVAKSERMFGKKKGINGCKN